MLIAENITKRFAGVLALDKVCLQLPPGKVTAIIGENGAGKSTLMKVLSGVYPDYEGRILYNGKPLRFGNTKEAQEAGIAIIHQELNLIPYLSVAENIFLGRELLTSFGTLDKKAMQTQTTALLHRLKLAVRPDEKIAALKVGQQQVIEIAKALLVEAQVIIMDEPTSAISESEVAVLFDIIAGLKRENKTVVYISHKLDELYKIADRYAVLRDGRSVESGDMKGVSRERLIQKMVGRDMVPKEREAAVHGGELLQVKNLCLKHPVKKDEDLLRSLSFSLNKGEVLGLFGLMGAGRTELFESLFGLHPKRSSGEIRIEGKKRQIGSPAEAIAGGLALVPEDRKKDGLIGGMAVRSNISLTTLNGLQKLGFINRKKESALAKGYIGDLQIKTSSETQLARNLSGGNQQKIVLAKWMATKPKVLLLDEPTRGIDVHAKNEIYKLIHGLAAEGLGIIVASSELPEILAVSDRVLVMAEGAITAELPVAEATEDNLLHAAIPKTL